MRVIAGSAKGRVLKTIKGFHIRPTTDRVKEALFSMIDSYIIDSVVVDLFAGTGGLGIEALSRGADKVYFVDNNKNSIQVLNENIRQIGFQEKSTVLFCDARRAVEKLTLYQHPFNIIFMDPPYLKDLIIPCMHAISNHNLLKDKGIITVEHDSKDVLPDKIGSLKRVKEKRYGNTMLSIYTEEER